MAWLKSVLNMRERFKLRTSPADSTIPSAAWFKGNQAEDLYARLGVKPTASLSEIRRAYRSRAKVFHPDVKPGDRASEDAFKFVAEAFAVLSDEEERRRYDESRQNQANNRSVPPMRNRRFPGEFARGFAAGGLTVFCLVSVIFLLDAKRREDLRANLAASILTERVATQNARPLQEDERATSPLDTTGQGNVDTASAASVQSDEAATQDASASREAVDTQTDQEHQKKKQTGALSLKDADTEVTSDTGPTEAATGSRHQPDKSYLAEAEPATAEADTKADAKQVELAVDKRERHDGSDVKPPAAEPSGAKSAHVEPDAENGEPSKLLTARSDTQPVYSRADRRLAPADPVDEDDVRSVVTRQIKAIRRRDGRAAFAVASSAVQSKFRDPHKFLEMIRTSYPDIPASKTASFLGLLRTRDKVIARFLLEETNGRLVEAHYYMVRSEGRWRIDGCVVIPR